MRHLRRGCERYDSTTTTTTTSTMINSITLVGRATALEFRQLRPGGAAMAAFTLTIQPRDYRELPPAVFRCEGYGMKIAEQFEQMDEGSLVGVIGTMTKVRTGPLVLIDRLEYLGKPLAQEVAA